MTMNVNAGYQFAEVPNDAEGQQMVRMMRKHLNPRFINFLVLITLATGYFEPIYINSLDNNDSIASGFITNSSVSPNQ